MMVFRKFTKFARLKISVFLVVLVVLVFLQMVEYVAPHYGNMGLVTGIKHQECEGELNEIGELVNEE